MLFLWILDVHLQNLRLEGEGVSFVLRAIYLIRNPGIYLKTSNALVSNFGGLILGCIEANLQVIMLLDFFNRLTHFAPLQT